MSQQFTKEEMDMLDSITASKPTEVEAGDKGESTVISVNPIKKEGKLTIIVNLKNGLYQSFSIPNGKKYLEDVLATYGANKKEDLVGKEVKYTISGFYTDKNTGELKPNILIQTKRLYYVKTKVENQVEEVNVEGLA